MKKIALNKIFVCVSMIICTMFFTSCIRKKQDNGKMLTKEIKVTPFQDLFLMGNATVSLIPGDTFKVVVRGKEKFVKEVTMKVENGVLIIDEKDHNVGGKGELSFGNFNFSDYRAEVYVTMPTLRNIRQEGNSDIHIVKPMKGDSVMFDIQGNSSINIAELTSKTFKLNIDGNSSVNVEALTADRTNVGIFGNSSMDINFVNAGDAQIGIEGNAFVSLRGTTKTEPICTVNGNGSINNKTVRCQKSK